MGGRGGHEAAVAAFFPPKSLRRNAKRTFFFFGAAASGFTGSLSLPFQSCCRNVNTKKHLLVDIHRVVFELRLHGEDVVIVCIAHGVRDVELAPPERHAVPGRRQQEHKHDHLERGVVQRDRFLQSSVERPLEFVESDIVVSGLRRCPRRRRRYAIVSVEEKRALFLGFKESLQLSVESKSKPHPRTR